MRNHLWVCMALLLCTMSATARPVRSPNKRITLSQEGQQYMIRYDGRTMLQLTSVGFSTIPSNDKPAIRFTRKVSTDYTMLAGKRLHCTNQANEYKLSLSKQVRMVFRLYNDGIAFRYEVDGLQNEQPPTEQTAYRIAEGTKRWMLRWTDSYEGFFPLSITGKGKNHRWAYPSLIEPQEGLFVLLSEANMERNQSASCLKNEVNDEIYQVCPDQNDLHLTGSWHTPWRVAIIGDLATIVESTLITDVSDPNRLEDTEWIRPGVVSWIYWANNHGSNDYNIIKSYVDMAVKLHLPYVLIDAEWDEFKDGKTVEDAIRYAHSCGIRPMIWYNSSVGWINGAPGPKFRLNKPEDREKEFAWCEKMGIAGVKIDFFSGDNQMNMAYCIDLMESAARHHLLVNFHGATIPRGWQRTYPNLLTTEAVYGAEWYNNVPTFTDKAASHNATLPFTRNVIGPMDYTPCAFSDSQHPHITTHAHELALTVLYESALQHLADRPESFLSQPQEVQQFLGHLPTVWDESRLVAGYPGDYAVMARRKGTTWYVAGINGNDEAKQISVDLSFIQGRNHHVCTFADSGDPQRPWRIDANSTLLPQVVTCQPRGGFVLVVN